MIDVTTNTELYNHLKQVNPDWVNFVSDKNPCKRGLIQLHSLGSQYEEPLSVKEQGDELLNLLKGELDNERMLRDDVKCQVNIHSVKLAMIRYDGINLLFDGVVDEIHIDDSWRVDVEYYIQ